MAMQENIPTSSVFYERSVIENFRRKKHEGIKARLIDMIHTFFESNNPRDFQPYSSIWSYCAPSFRCEGHGPACAALGIDDVDSSMDLEQFIRYRCEVALRYPSLHTRVTNVSVTLGDQDRAAQVYAYIEIHGLPEGTIRPVVAMVDFVLFAPQRGKEGKWRMLQMRRLPGMAIGGDMFPV